tara:strand:+ start:692 stop:1303 length:612 start_codon:yes stop_codon:yes gene_type:complete
MVVDHALEGREAPPAHLAEGLEGVEGSLAINNRSNVGVPDDHAARDRGAPDQFRFATSQVVRNPPDHAVVPENTPQVFVVGQDVAQRVGRKLVGVGLGGDYVGRAGVPGSKGVDRNLLVLAARDAQGNRNGVQDGFLDDQPGQNQLTENPHAIHLGGRLQRSCEAADCRNGIGVELDGGEEHPALEQERKHLEVSGKEPEDSG